jgi:hypothetical protein
MNADEFVAQVKAAIVEENTRIYSDLFENTKTATDPYWARALALYNALDTSQRSVFMEVVRQTAIDTVSNVFALIDGTVRLHGQDGDVRFACGGEELSGELQDRFLEQCE